jgi:hypothetical protein
MLLSIPTPLLLNVKLTDCSILGERERKKEATMSVAVQTQTSQLCALDVQLKG